ncbi:MAG TPA: hypothetical protein VFK25_01615 [Candidatus Binatia bacterium]|nr:hypothetical protein [Candidatus Binatia bacterium]
MENLETDRLILHEGHEDEYGDDEDGIVMDEDHPMWRSERITLNSVGIDIAPDFFPPDLASAGHGIIKPFRCGQSRDAP